MLTVIRFRVGYVHLSLILIWKKRKCHKEIEKNVPWYDNALNRKLRVTGLCEGNSPMTGEFPHKGPVTRKMFPFDDVIMWWFTLIPFASWFLLPALPLNYALSCSENGLVPQERIKTIFSQNKPIFKQKMSLKMVSAKYRPFVGTGETYTISLEICTRIGCALFCCGHNIIDSLHTFYWLGL